tara:strand:- start:1917 stop:3395 length:1479 start_codon:yes stop_codon:yes gene_type:complete
MISAYLEVFSLSGTMWVLLGTVVGILIGSIPGLSGAMVIALALPMTYYMQATDALILLVAMYIGSTTGGLISATLMRMPGTESAIMTTLDGFPMAQRGEPARALGLGVIASFIGGMFAWLVLTTLSPLLSTLAVRFGPYEIFSMTVVALTLIAAISKGSFMNGLLAAALGALFALPGIDPISGSLRLTFNIAELDNGFNLLPVMLGLLVLGQVMIDSGKKSESVIQKASGSKKVIFSAKDFKENLWNFARSSIIGTWIGILPGIGGTTASIASYSVAKGFSKNSSKFGNGCSEGIVAAESANNAGTVGSLVPLITLGIPGSVVTAILLGAMVMHNLNPGPLLFVQNPGVAYTIIAGVLSANLIILVVMWFATPLISRMMYVDKAWLLPPIIIFCFIGAYSVSGRFFDVIAMCGFACLGYILVRAKVPLGPFIIAFILTPMAEENLRSGLVVYGSSYLPLLTRPIPLFFIVISIITAVWAVWSEIGQARKAKL